MNNNNKGQQMVEHNFIQYVFFFVLYNTNQFE